MIGDAPRPAHRLSFSSLVRPRGYRRMLFNGHIRVGFHPVAVEVFNDEADGVFAGRAVENLVRPERIAEGQRAAFFEALIDQAAVAVQILSLIHI